jgi:hypothetical protein
VEKKPERRKRRRRDLALERRRLRSNIALETREEEEVVSDLTL